MALTNEQKQAVESFGKNIIVSAGAGSGKTFVLTERVKHHLLQGIHISELLILTFTNAAAAEMKTRIRKMIQKTPELSGELDSVDGAFITTFDSFALSIVKKYHTKLNISNQIQISDEVLIDCRKKEILEEILDEYYQKPSPEFLKLIEDFCLKDDQKIKDVILNAYKKVELKVKKQEYFDSFLDSKRIEDKISSTIEEYLSILKSRQKDLQNLMDQLGEYFDGDFVSKMEDNFKKLLEANSYEEFLEGIQYESLRVPNGSSEEGKRVKASIYEIAKEFSHYCIYSSTSEMREEYLSTLDYQKVLFSILKELDFRLDSYKKENGLYNFNDIARNAILVVEENPDVLEELKNSFQEIMIDEYQDTSDTQEYFISLISKNNVYMVGDIKQSIYRFRNANPSLFKEKYREYQDSNKGIKIDLLKNFRSRREVLEDINLLFDSIMDEEIGGANYSDSHRMEFGNEDYESLGKTNENSHMEVLVYDEKELGSLTKEEEEAFLIGKDIQEKIQKKMLVFDKDLRKLRPVEYKDIVVLLDKSTHFTLYKRIFETYQIPLTILKEESLRKDEDGLVIRNLFRFLICVKENRFDLEFRYTFVSLCRSFLWKMSDDEIYHIFVEETFKDTEIYQKAFSLAKEMDQMSLSQFFLHVMREFHYEEKILTIGNVESFLVRLEYFYNLCKNYEDFGYTVYDFSNYLNQIFEGDYDLKFNVHSSLPNSCQIMTIHKSKGLEFPICYYAGFSSKFAEPELKERILFDSELGFVLPKVEESYKDTYVKELVHHSTKKEDVSERIRLLYVAMTRAREKMIFVFPKQEEESECRGLVPTIVREKYSSFLSILKSIISLFLPYSREVPIIGSKEYLFSSKKEEYPVSQEDSIRVEENGIQEEIIEKEQYSKKTLSLFSKEEKEKMRFGTEIHEVLRDIDFQNYDLSSYNLSNYVQKKITSFLESDFMKKRNNCFMVKEYEFIDNQGESLSHGMIDLLIDEGDTYTIVDYKLKGLEDSAYQKQLNGYRHFIEKKMHKRVQCYLYSILEETFLEVIDD